MPCINGCLSFVVLRRNREGAPGRRAGAVGRREYANAEETESTVFDLIEAESEFLHAFLNPVVLSFF